MVISSRVHGKRLLSLFCCPVSVLSHEEKGRNESNTTAGSQKQNQISLTTEDEAPHRDSSTENIAHTSYVKNSGRWQQLFATFTVCLAAYGSGSNGGWASPMLMVFDSDSSPIGKVSWTEIGSYLESLPLLASIVGVYLYGAIIDLWGRKIAGYVMAVKGIVGWTFLILATSPIHLYIGRFFTGLFSVGGLMVGPIYLSEVVEESSRGTLMSSLMFVANLAILVTYVLGDVLTYRWFNVVCIVPLILFLIFFFWLPESPYYLASKSRTQDAEDSLLWFRGGNQEVATMEFNALTNNNHQNGPSCMALMRSKSSRRAVLLVLFINSFQQLGGTQIIQGYASVIFKDIGSVLSPNQSAMVLIAIKLVATYSSVLLVDRLGRRPMMISMFFATALCMTVLSVYLYLEKMKLVAEHAWLPLAVLCTFNVAYSVGVGTLAEVMGSELVPIEIKGTSSIICGTITLSLTMVTLQAYPSIHDQIGTYANFILPAVINYLGSLIVFYKLPETRGKTLTEIQMILSADVYTVR